MVRLVIFVISGIHKIFFPLWLAVIAVRHHQIPVYILVNDIIRGVKRIVAFSNVFDNLSAHAGFFFHFPKCSFIVLFTLFNCSLRQNPAFVFIPVILIQQQDFSSKDYHTTTACCFNHCNSSCFFHWCVPKLNLL